MVHVPPDSARFARAAVEGGGGAARGLQTLAPLHGLHGNCLGRTRGGGGGGGGGSGGNGGDGGGGDAFRCWGRGGSSELGSAAPSLKPQIGADWALCGRVSRTSRCPRIGSPARRCRRRTVRGLWRLFVVNSRPFNQLRNH